MNWFNYLVPIYIQDVDKTSRAIGPALKETINVQYTPFYHLDFVIASDADRLLYNRMIEIMDNQLYGLCRVHITLGE